MFHLPGVAHNLKAPFAVYASQQGNVDWFDFWLNDREDEDSQKADQYARWRELRNAQRRVVDTAR